jgi:hypothetical protein
MKKVVILNGSPGSGKDVAAKEMCARFEGEGWICYHKQFKQRLIDITCAIYGISGCEWNNLYTREGKEKPHVKLGGMSPRQALIHVSENIIKLHFEKDFFGRAAAQSLYEGINIFSDGGFIEELRPIITEVGASNVLILRIHREGYTFKGDSRSFLPDNIGPITVDVSNNGTQEEFFGTVEYEIDRWLKALISQVEIIKGGE